MKVKFERLTANVGARVRGFDPSATGDSESEQALRGALRHYKLLSFHLPGFSAADQARLAGMFGEISTRRTSYGGSPSGETEYVSNTRADGTLGNGPFHYHHDHLFYEQPLSALMLYGLEIPTSGTVTKFRDGHGFYESLPEETKATVRGIDALHMLDFRTDEVNRRCPAFRPGRRHRRQKRSAHFHAGLRQRCGSGVQRSHETLYGIGLRADVSEHHVVSVRGLVVG